MLSKLVENYCIYSIILSPGREIIICTMCVYVRACVGHAVFSETTSYTFLVNYLS